MTDTTSKRRSTAAKEAVPFSDEERAAMQERAREVKAEKRRASGGSKADPEAEVLAKIADMGPADRTLAETVHRIVRENAPHLTPRTWYGMPAYAKDGKVLCFFKAAEKFNGRYAVLGFEDPAQLDEGAMWPVVYALTTLSAADEERVAELVRRAAG
jgi:uncharacterized protein YdhG (YjbR/CyaY superfamily)